MGQIQTAACFCMTCTLKMVFTFLKIIYHIYIEREIYFEESAHTIVETWHVQNLDGLEPWQAGDSGKNHSSNPNAVC